MSWADKFIAVDWGTTNRRAYLVEDGAPSGREFEDGRGILSVERGQFEEAVRQVRDELGDAPMLLAGMIGSNRGWVDAPYVPCPAGLQELAGKLVQIPEENAAIVPGVSFSNGRSDVMRGEEVQLLGAITAGDVPSDCVVCHPGTHNKWVRVRNRRIDSFRTVMTGELFNMVREGSILSELTDGEASPGDAFLKGVRQGLTGAGITTELFEARARFLLGRLDRRDGPSFVSGLLIGEDVRIGIADGRPADVIVMGRPELTELYACALNEAGVEAVQIDGEGAFIAGACKIAERIQ